MDLATIIGLVAALVLMLFGMATGDEGIAGLRAFWDIKSVLITFGGAFMATLAMTSSIKQYATNLKSIKLVLKVLNTNEEDTIRTIISLSNVARKEGLLALEEASNSIDDDFLKKGILLIVDGTDPELVRNILETELMCIESRHKSVIGFWDNLGAMGPAWGMIGTLIGLIQMLGNMSDVNSVGPKMAVALVTTFYGSLLANWICTPVSTKLKANSEMETAIKSVMVEGLLSIQAGENPRVIEEKLKSFLSPERRKELVSTEGGEEK